MKNKRVTTCLCAGLLLFMVTGCGKSDEYLDVPEVDIVKVDNVIDTNAEESISQSSSEESTNEQSDNLADDGGSLQNNNEDLDQQPNNAQLRSDFELDGDIESIGDNCVVINKVFHPSENVAVSYGEAEKKELITTYFSEETIFEVWTIKNSGVNGEADTEKRQGAFSDLKQDTYIRITGSYSGNDFYAKHVIIHYYI